MKDVFYPSDVPVAQDWFVSLCHLVEFGLRGRSVFDKKYFVSPVMQSYLVNNDAFST